MKKLFGIVLMLMVSMVTSADEEETLVNCDISKFTGGKVEKTLEVVVSEEKEDSILVQVTINVTPAPGYYITKDDIVVMATYPLPPTPTQTKSTRAEDEEEQPRPEFAGQIELSGNDPEDLTTARLYTFIVVKGLGVWVTEANFRQIATYGEVGDVKWNLKVVESKGAEEQELILTLEGKGAASLGDGSAPWAMQKSAITNLIVGKGVTALGDNLLSGCDNLKSVEIQNGESVITLGADAIPANENLTIDVPGNLFNKYQLTDCWTGFLFDSKNGVKMDNVKFVENRNQFDVYASLEKNLMLPAGVKGYTIKGVQGNKILLNDVTTISVGEPVLLFSDEIKTEDLRTAPVLELNKTRAGEETKEGEGTEEGEEEPIIEYALKLVTAEDPDIPVEEQGLDVELGQVYMLYNDVFYPTQAGRIPVGGIYLEEVKMEEPDPKENVDKKSFTRLYLTLDGVADADDAVTTGISQFSIPDSQFSSSWYDLSGRKLNGVPTAKGVYINNGKKMIIR